MRRNGTASKFLSVVLVYCIVFFGVPLPSPSGVPVAFRAPLEKAHEAFGIPEAMASQIKNVYQGTIALDNTDLVVTATLPAAVDTSKSILFVKVSGSQTT